MGDWSSLLLSKTASVESEDLNLLVVRDREGALGG